jgi:high-affinity nickel-transport protein
VALFVGTIEALSVLHARFSFKGVAWDLVNHLSNNFGLLGFVIVGAFAASWGVSVVVYKSRGYDLL